MVDLESFSPAPIPDNLRLGHQMESICKQLLEHSSQFDVLVYNLPIREGKQTLGEIDFILKDATSKQIIHVELTYKFYIINPDISEPLHQLIGPNKSDAFFMKMEKIKNKQFALLHSEAGTAVLSSLNIDASKLIHQTCFKAQLFKPYHLEALHLSPLNKNCIVGYWLRLKNFTTDAFGNYQFYIPTKKEWALNPEVNIEWISYTDALLAIKLQIAKQKSPLVWMKKNDMQFEKFFVVWW